MRTPHYSAARKPVFIRALSTHEMQDWATTVSRRVWTSELKPIKAIKPQRMEQFCIGEAEEDCADADDPVYWFIGLRGGVYSLKRYAKIKLS